MTDLTQVMPTNLPAQGELMPTNAINNGVFQVSNFNEAINAANFLSGSTLVPSDYRRWNPRKTKFGKQVYENNVAIFDENPNATSNCLIALNMANRMGYDPLMIMQNLYIIEGRPAWSSQFIIAAINACGKFSPLRFDIVNHGETEVEYNVVSWENDKKIVTPVKTTIENISCVAWATEKATGQRIESAKIDMLMAVKEGWYQKNGSKWQTMPDQMLRYRAAAFFGRIYAPEILMGIYSADEVRDFVDVTPDTSAPASPAFAQTIVAEQIPCYDIKPLLAQIEAITELDEVKPLGLHIKELSENPAVNLCGDDLPTLREALTAKRDQIKAQLEQAQQVQNPSAEPTAESSVQAEPTEEVTEPAPKPKKELSNSKKLVSDFVKAISVATLDQSEELTATLFAMKPEIGEANFNHLEGILDSKMNELYEATQVEVEPV